MNNLDKLADEYERNEMTDSKNTGDMSTLVFSGVRPKHAVDLERIRELLTGLNYEAENVYLLQQGPDSKETTVDFYTWVDELHAITRGYYPIDQIDDELDDE